MWNVIYDQQNLQPPWISNTILIKGNILCKIYVETITMRMIKYHMFTLQTGSIRKENLVYNSI